MKKIILILVFALINMSCIIKDPKPEECVVQTKTIINIKEGTSFDIVFSDNQGDHYYINRGLEHIAQLSVEDKVIFTEFN